MQTLVQVICTPGKSLRDAIVSDPRLDKSSLFVFKAKQPGRPGGWAKVYSLESDTQGAVNIEWDHNAFILLCRIVNRGRGRPYPLVGDLTNYLLRKYRRRIVAINVIPRTE